jgi:predicted GNAT family acetyltransferase
VEVDVPDLQIRNNTDDARYEARVGQKMAGFAEYQLAKDLIVFTHTEVEPAYEGQGIGSALARAALDDVRQTERKVLPLCPFIKGWMEHHREYVDLVYGAQPSKVVD